MKTKQIKFSLNYLWVALFSLSLVACSQDNNNTENEKEEPAKSTLTLLSESEYTFTAEGGTGLIEYELTNPVQGVDIAVKCNTNWVEDFTYASASSISFKVRANSFQDSRSAVVTVTYGSECSFSINIQQEGYTEPEEEIDVEFHATHYNSTYYGRMGTSGFNHFVILSDTGAPNASSYYYNSTQYRLDLYAEQTGFYDDRLPVGTYNYDSRNSGKPGTFAPEYSSNLVVTDYDLFQYDIIDGTVIVTEDSIEALLYLQNGELHKVTYTGEMKPGYPDIDPDALYSTLDRDYTINFDSGSLDCYYRGDRYGVGYDCWLVNIIEDPSDYSGSYLQFEVLVTKSQSGLQSDKFLGNFTQYEYPSDNFINTFMPGSKIDGFSLQGSWYSRCESGIIDNFHQAPLMDGSLSITKSGNTYTLTFECVDDMGHTIQGTVSGSIRGVYDNSAGV